MRISFLISFLISYTSYTQSSVSVLWDLAAENYNEGKFDESILYYDSLFAANPEKFTLAFIPRIYVPEGKEAVVEFMEKYSQSKLKSNFIAHPITAFLRIRKTNDKQELLQEKSKLFDSLSSGSEAGIYTGLYHLASFFELRSKLGIPEPEQISFLKLMAAENQRINVHSIEEIAYSKEYIHFVLTYELFMKGEKQAEDLFRINASQDMLFRLSFYSEFELTTEFVTFIDVYQKLIEQELSQHPSNVGYLEYGVKLVNIYPEKKNLDWLKKLYEKGDQKESFADFWFKNTMKWWGNFPGNEKIKQEINTFRDENDWLIIDIWGDWCGPCVKELPEMDNMDVVFKENPDLNLKLLTFSFFSSDLKGFMRKNKYGFKVVEIEEEESESMNIKGYPTTFLLSPSNKFILIPWGIDKTEMIRTLTLTDW